LVHRFVSGMPSRRTNNFPESGRGLGHVTFTILGSTVGYPSDSLASCSTLCSLIATTACTDDLWLYFYGAAMAECKLDRVIVCVYCLISGD